MDLPERPGALVVENHNGPFQVEIMAAGRRLVADQPVKAGGMGMGPTPFDLLAASLGACTSMTIRLFANRHQLPLQKVRVEVTYSPAAEVSEVDFERTIEFTGCLSPEQERELLEVSERCPVLKTLGAIEVRTRCGPIGDPAKAAAQAKMDHMIAMEQALRAS
jgi:putative redox protein